MSRHYISVELRRLVSQRAALTNIGEVTARILKFNNDERIRERQFFI